MASTTVSRHSLKARITLSTLIIFVIGIWALAFYAGSMLREDMERLLGEQQMSTASLVAADIQQELNDRLRSLEAVAASIDAGLIDKPEPLQSVLEQRPILGQMFNGGTFITGTDGTATASLPRSAQRVGVNYMDRDHVAAALGEGRTTISKPVIGKVLQAPVVSMGAPLRDAQGTVKGALVGVTDLGKPNFLSRMSSNRYSKTGEYLLVAPQYRLVVTASDKKRIFETLPAPGVNPAVDRFIQGYEGSAVLINPLGVEVLASAKGIPVAGWYVVAALPTEEAFAPIHAMQQRMLMATLVLTLLAAALTWWMLRRQLAPMVAAVATLSAQSRSSRPPHPLPIARNDEVGELIGGFNGLLEALNQREQALHDSEARYQRAVNGANDGIWEWFPASGDAYLSPRWKQLIGYEDHELRNVGESFFDQIHPDDQACTAEALRAHFEEQRPYEIELRLRCKNGDYRWFHARGQATWDAQGRPLSMAGSLGDITGRKQEEEVNTFLSQVGGGASGEPFFDALARFLAESLQMDYVCIDRLEGDGLNARTLAVWHDGHFEENVTYALSDTPCGDVVGQKVCCFPASVCQFFPRDQALQELRAESYIGVTLWSHSGQPIGLIAVIGRHPLANRAQAEITMERVAARAAGELERLMAETEIRRLNTDLERRVLARTADLEAANQALTRANLEAQAANVAKSSFLANMSHEIRTPMNAILGMANLLRRGGVTPQQADRLDKIDGAARHLLSIINDILDISKIEAGKFVLEETPVAVGALLANVCSILSERTRAKKLRLVVEPVDLPRNLVGDATRLQQALLNFAANAVKFTDTGTVILRALRQEETDQSVRVRFEVQDTGIGISPEAMSRLFGAFEQADNSMTRKYGGTGLGLAISRRLAELMGGEAGADSTLGVGSTFWFTATLKKSGEVAAAQAAGNADAESLLRERHVGKRILVVDDEPTNLEVAQIQLEAVGLVVDTAPDGAAAITLALEASYALILMDMQMPRINGLEATLQIRQLPGYRQTPIIAMTANAFAEDKLRCFDAGMNDFLIKPFEPVALFGAVLRALGQQEG